MGQRILYAPAVGTVYHVGAVSSDVVWTERERLERCYLGGITAYGMLHGGTRGALYRAAELVGTSARWAVYSLVSAVRGSPYARLQAEKYGWLARFYLGPAGRWRAELVADVTTPPDAGTPRG
jgi:hypothetical protein